MKNSINIQPFEYILIIIYINHFPPCTCSMVKKRGNCSKHSSVTLILRDQCRTSVHMLVWRRYRYHGVLGYDCLYTRHAYVYLHSEILDDLLGLTDMPKQNKESIQDKNNLWKIWNKLEVNIHVWYLIIKSSGILKSKMTKWLGVSGDNIT